jgi:DNA-directed RNA polymerase sigma subunit (sigma70/sigma32)
MPQKNQEGENEDIGHIEEQLRLLLSEEVTSHSIDEQDRLILLLRLGLNSENCYTLTETSQALHLAPERIRQRQYFLLRRKIKNPLFFKLLRKYALGRKLPPGFELHNLPEE